MTVGSRDARSGRLAIVTEETSGRNDGFDVAFEWRLGKIHSDLTVGPDVQAAERLRANCDLSFMGVTLVGEGFRLREGELRTLGFSPDSLPSVIRVHANGREVSRGGEPMFVVDFFGLEEEQCRNSYPTLYQWLAQIGFAPSVLTTNASRIAISGGCLGNRALECGVRLRGWDASS